jgi:hypothetical protein
LFSDGKAIYLFVGGDFWEQLLAVHQFGLAGVVVVNSEFARRLVFAVIFNFDYTGLYVSIVYQTKNLFVSVGMCGSTILHAFVEMFQSDSKCSSSDLYFDVYLHGRRVFAGFLLGSNLCGIRSSTLGGVDGSTFCDGNG